MQQDRFYLPINIARVSIYSEISEYRKETMKEVPTIIYLIDPLLSVEPRTEGGVVTALSVEE